MTRTHIFKVMVLGAPLVAGLVSEFFMYLADSAMVGRLGTEFLAAIGIATLFGEILWVIVWPLAPGTQTIASRRFGLQEALGGKDEKTRLEQFQKTGEVLDSAVVVSIGAGFIAIMIALFSEPILRLLLEDDHLIHLAQSYILILKWAMPLAGIFYALYGFLAAINLTRIIMIATVGLNVLNIGFNYMLIFGKFGFPALGIRGAALGTVIAQALGTLYLVAFVLFSSQTKDYQCLRFLRFQSNLSKEVSKAASPIVIQLAVALSIFLYYESVIANIGTIYLAVTHIVFTTFLLTRTMVGGFAEGGSILVGNSLGRGEKKEAVRYAYASELIAIFMASILLFAILLFPESIVKIFTNEVDTVKIGANALRFLAIFIFIEAIGFPFEIIFTHNGWGKYALFSEITTNVVFIVGATLLFTRAMNLGIYGAWSAFALYLVFHSGFMVAGFFSKRWLDIQIESQTVEQLSQQPRMR